MGIIVMPLIPGALAQITSQGVKTYTCAAALLPAAKGQAR